jgi:hypothetical protein
VVGKKSNGCHDLGEIKNWGIIITIVMSGLGLDWIGLDFFFHGVHAGTWKAQMVFSGV